MKKLLITVLVLGSLSSFAAELDCCETDDVCSTKARAEAIKKGICKPRNSKKDMHKE